MESTTDRLVLVPARHLDDVLELARRLSDRLDPTDPLAFALRAATAQLRSEAVPEPS